jgi:short-subunit dehydrogenase
VASGTALQGSPGYASYAATKAFDLVLGESLWHELHEHGVEVMAFVPGPTNTPGLRSTLPGLREGQSVGPIELPATTAEAALDALGSGPAAAREPEHQAALDARRRATTRILARRRA